MYWLLFKCVLYYCHRVATQLQLTNVSFFVYLNPNYLPVLYLLKMLTVVS